MAWRPLADPQSHPLPPLLPPEPIDKPSRQGAYLKRVLSESRSVLDSEPGKDGQGWQLVERRPGFSVFKRPVEQGKKVGGGWAFGWVDGAGERLKAGGRLCSGPLLSQVRLTCPACSLLHCLPAQLTMSRLEVEVPMPPDQLFELLAHTQVCVGRFLG